MYIENLPILLANSPEQNFHGKICSHRNAKLDENRTSALTSSTIMQSMDRDCRLVVISPAVSLPFREMNEPRETARGGRGLSSYFSTALPPRRVGMELSPLVGRKHLKAYSNEKK